MRTLRTNRVGSSIRFTVTGTDHVGLTFGDSFRVPGSETHTFVPGRIFYRVINATLYPSSQTYRNVLATGTVIMADRLDPAELYDIDVLVDRLGSFEDERGVVVTDVMRWSESDGTPDPDTEAEYGAFVEITNILIQDGGTVDIPPTTTVDVLIIGDGVTDGRLLETAGKDTWHPYDIRVDAGVCKSYTHLAVRNYATDTGDEARIRYVADPRATITNLAGGAFPWTFPDRTTYRTEDEYRAGLGVNVDTGATVDSGSNLSHLGNIFDMADQHVAGVPIAADYEPAVIVFELGLLDRLIEDPINTDWISAVATSYVAGVTRLSNRWPSATLIYVYPHLSSGEDDPVAAVIADVIVACSSLPNTYQIYDPKETIAAQTGQNLAPWGLVLTPAQSELLATQLGLTIIG